MLNKLRIILIGCLIILNVSSPAQAEIAVSEVTRIEQISGYNFIVTDKKVELTTDTINEEIILLEKRLPLLQDVDLNLTLVNQSYKQDNYSVGGITYRNKNLIYIFADGDKEAIVHEIGHFIRNNFISDKEIKEYTSIRGINNLNENEVFAEDFRMLFGSKEAIISAHREKIEPPRNAQWQWFVKKFSLTWKDSLDFYSRNIQAADEEMARAMQVSHEKMNNGDVIGVERAMNWYFQVMNATL